MTHVSTSWLVVWGLAAGLVNARSVPAHAQTDGEGSNPGDGISLDVDLFGTPEPSQDICYGRPENWHPKLEPIFRRVFEGAAAATRPEHAVGYLRFLESEDATGCAHRVLLFLEPGRKGEPRDVAIQLVDAGTVLLKTRAGPLVPVRSTSAEFEPAWRELWPVIAPEPLPPPPPPAEDETFVDTDLVEARETLEPVERDVERGPYVTALALAGVTSRSLDVQPNVGRPQDLGVLFSAGARADLHVGGWFGLDGHRLDGQVEYWRQFATAQVDGEDVGTSADRLRGHLAYGRRWFGAALPELALVAAVEYRRFTFDALADTLSTELTVLRPGLDLEQVLVGRNGPTRLALSAGGRARIPIGSGSEDFELGFDGRVALQLRLEVGFIAEVAGEYTRQSGSAAPIDFSEDFVDLVVGIGWTL